MDTVPPTTPAPAAPPARWLVIGLSVLTVVTVGMLSLALFRDDVERVDRDETAGSIAPLDLTVAGDAFDRPDADGLVDTDHPWEELSGGWAVQDGHAALVEPAAGNGRNLVVLPTGTAQGVVRVTVTAVEPGWGVAFRVQDDANYLSLVARTDTGSWSLERMVDGVPTETTDFLVQPPADGDRMEIRLLSTTIAVSVNGGAPAEATEEALVDAEGIGLLSLTGDNAPSMAWDDIEMAEG